MAIHREDSSRETFEIPANVDSAEEVPKQERFWLLGRIVVALLRILVSFIPRHEKWSTLTGSDGFRKLRNSDGNVVEARGMANGLLTVEETSQRLGLTTNYVYRLVAKKKLPPSRSADRFVSNPQSSKNG